jgi:26S proteasome regulatory subunit N11
MGGGGGGGGRGMPQPEVPKADTSEQVYVSSLALLKMLRHGRAGIPMEVMGLMLGEFIDDYTVCVGGYSEQCFGVPILPCFACWA